MTKLEILPPDEQTAALPTEQLLAHLNSESPHLRARVFAGLGKRLHEGPHVFERVLDAIQAPENRLTPFFGFITVSWIGVTAVLENGNAKQVQRVANVVRQWSATEQDDLLHHLRDSGLESKLGL